MSSTYQDRKLADRYGPLPEAEPFATYGGYIKMSRNHRNMTDAQFTRVCGIIQTVDGYQVEYPFVSGEDPVLIENKMGQQFNVEPDGKVTQGQREARSSADTERQTGEHEHPSAKAAQALGTPRLDPEEA